MPEFSFHAIVGIEHPRTIRLQGKLKGREIMILIDGGNFVNHSLVMNCGLPVTHNKTFQVMVRKDRFYRKMSCCTFRHSRISS